MKKGNKLISVILVITLISLSVICMPAFTCAEAELSGKCGDGANWKYNVSTAVLTVFGSGTMYDYSINKNSVTSAPWQDSYDKIKTVIVEDGITQIGSYAFFGCDNIKTVVMGNSVTSIGAKAFNINLSGELYFKGTAENWEAKKNTVFECFKMCKTYYYYCNQNSHIFNGNVCTVCGCGPLCCGDVTGNGVIDSGDLIRLKKSIAGQNVIINKTCADVTGDDTADGVDLVRLKKYFAGQDVRLDGRVLVWGDEFNSGTFADRSDKFSTKVDTMTPDYKNGVLKCSASEEFIYVANGCLNLHAKDNGDNTFTTARPICTYNKMGFLYGYVEMRARVPFGGGYFPSFWMQTLYKKSESGAFAEVDMFESFGSGRQIQSGLSKWFTGGNSVPDFNSTALMGSVNYTFTSNKQARDWHTYALEWTPEILRFYVDGYNYFSVLINDENNFGVTSPGMEVFRQPAQLNINHWLYYNVMIRDNFRMDEKVNYEIDYIRLYQKPGETLIIGDGN